MLRNVGMLKITFHLKTKERFSSSFPNVCCQLCYTRFFFFNDFKSWLNCDGNDLE